MLLKYSVQVSANEERSSSAFKNGSILIAEAAKKFRLYGHQIQRWIDDKARSER